MNRSESVRSEPEASVEVAVEVAAVEGALDARTLLARVDDKIVALRRLIRHDHADLAYWTAHGTTAPRARSDRAILRRVADLLHVERAHRRKRLHGTRFSSLDQQHEWLESMLHRTCACAAVAAGLPTNASLARLRAGELPREST